MKFLRIGLDGDYVYTEKINGRNQTVRISGVLDKKEARKRAKAAFDEMKATLAPKPPRT